jgi:hypothetical protein
MNRSARRRSGGLPGEAATTPGRATAGYWHVPQVDPAQLLVWPPNKLQQSPNDLQAESHQQLFNEL